VKLLVLGGDFRHKNTIPEEVLPIFVKYLAKILRNGVARSEAVW